MRIWNWWGFRTSNKLKNHWSTHIYIMKPPSSKAPPDERGGGNGVILSRIDLKKNKKKTTRHRMHRHPIDIGANTIICTFVHDGFLSCAKGLATGLTLSPPVRNPRVFLRTLFLPTTTKPSKTQDGLPAAFFRRGACVTSRTHQPQTRRAERTRRPDARSSPRRKVAREVWSGERATALGSPFGVFSNFSAADPRTHGRRTRPKQGNLPELNARDSRWFGASSVCHRRRTGPAPLRPFATPIGWFLRLSPPPSPRGEKKKKKWVGPSDESRSLAEREAKERRDWLDHPPRPLERRGSWEFWGNLFLFVPGEERGEQQAINNTPHGSHTVGTRQRDLCY